MSAAEEEKANQRIRKLDSIKFKRLKISDKDDCIYGAMKGIRCAAMSCGCAMAPQTMFDYIKSIFEKYTTSYKIMCPYHKEEKVEWDWDYCTEVADLNDAEYHEWNGRREKRKYHNIQKCPECQNLNERKDNIQFRMQCERCGFAWCWECQQNWNGSGNLFCGNKSCTLIELINEELKQAPLINLTYIHQMVPEIRACPRCMTRMKHIGSCKHMRCVVCQKEFCFCCLSLKTEGKWPCGNHTVKCIVKERQQFGKKK